MTIVKIRALAPEVRFVIILVSLDVVRAGGPAIERIDDAERRLVNHRLRKPAIEEIELRVVVMAREVPAIGAVEPAVAQDEFHVLVLGPVMPDGGGVLPLVKRAIGHVTPAARADKIHRALQTAVRLVTSATVAPPERNRVRPVTQHVAIHDHRAVAGAENGEGVRPDD